MGITEKSYKKLTKYARDKFSGNDSLYATVAIFDSGDLLHSYFASRKFVDSDDIEELIANFKDFISETIRNAKRRRDAGRIIRHSDNMVLGNFGENYKQDDLIDGYIYRNSPLYQRVNTKLYDYSYSENGKIDYDLMLEDMQKTMGECDRAYHVYNKNTESGYWVGNPLAIPLESLYNGQFYSASKEELRQDGMG